MRAAIVAVSIVCNLLAGGCTSGPAPTREFSEEECNRHYEAKQAALERCLGPMYSMIGHAIVPFGLSGDAVDMYYFPNGIPGTGFATMELIEPDGSGPKPNRIGTYELVTFTKLRMPRDSESDENHPFNKIERRMCLIMTGIGLYSYHAVINPGETCELPVYENEPNQCLIFDEYRRDGTAFEIEGRKHCLLLCIEVFCSEMEYAVRHGSDIVLRKLKATGHCPYSDLDREPVFREVVEQVGGMCSCTPVSADCPSSLMIWTEEHGI